MLRALKVSYSDVGEGGVALHCEKNTIFPEHPVLNFEVLFSLRSKEMAYVCTNVLAKQVLLIWHTLQ